MSEIEKSTIYISQEDMKKLTAGKLVKLKLNPSATERRFVHISAIDLMRRKQVADRQKRLEDRMARLQQQLAALSEVKDKTVRSSFGDLPRLKRFSHRKHRKTCDVCGKKFHRIKLHKRLAHEGLKCNLPWTKKNEGVVTQ